MTDDQSNHLSNEPAHRLTLAEYLIQRLAMPGALGLAELARRLGLKNAAAIRMFVASELKVPFDMVLPLARVLNVPFPPLFRLAMEQFGESMTEIAAELFDGPDGAIRHRSSEISDGAAAPEVASSGAVRREQRPAGPLPPLHVGAPSMIDITFRLPIEFCLQFVVEAARRGLGLNDFFMLAFQSYRGPWRAAQPSDGSQGDGGA
jgi:hypothetical protein